MKLTLPQLSHTSSYCLAIGLTVVVTLFREFLAPLLGEDDPMILYMTPPVLAGFMLGFGPGIVATILSGLLGVYISVLPHHAFAITDAADHVRFVVFLVIGLSLSLFGAQRRRHLATLEKLEKERSGLLTNERLARLEAERAGKAKDEFLAVLSHELRTPLSAVLGWTQLLLRRGKSEPTIQEGLETIERNARSQTRLIDDLLDMSRIASGKIQLRMQPVNLQYVVESAVSVIKPLADHKSVELKSVIEPGLPMISGDANRLEQIAINLLNNAVKFTPPGGQVTISLSRKHESIELRVRDTGRGISREFLPFVFEKFRQADKGTTRQYGGLGLGLALVKSFVELHGGVVTAFSEGEGKGTTMTVTLPISNARISALNGDRDSSYENLPRLKHLKVLVVDDEPDARELIRQTLEDCDAETNTASSVQEALAVLDAKSPDVLISDIGMPDEDGYSLIKRVRASSARYSRIPAIALTGFGTSGDRERSLAAGFQAHLVKPVESAQLLATVGRLCAMANSDKN